MNKLFVIVLVVVIVGIGAFALSRDGGDMEQASPAPSESNGAMSFKFSNPKKSAHYETNTPAHGAILPAPPINVVIDFNFDLAAPSDISIMNNGKEYGVGTIAIDSNKLAMRKNVDSNAPDGLYKVSYNACWPDRSCHTGFFEFAIDRSLTANYESTPTVRLSNLRFNPKNIRIKKGTTVTWINDENVEHYINTDSHPAHTYYPAQNSRLLKQGDTYSVTFNTPGAYPYHCSAHVDTMMGMIVVE